MQTDPTQTMDHCTNLLARLMHIRGFPKYVSLARSLRYSSDPVTRLWDVFALGVPLCYLFDLLPEDAGFGKINHSEFDEEQYNTNPDRAMKHAIALFAIQIQGENLADKIPGCEAFTVTDLWDRSSTDGFSRAVTTVSAIVNHLPQDTFITGPLEKLPAHSVPLRNNWKAQETLGTIVRELVETERKYVQDLHILQNYAAVVAQSNLINREIDDICFAYTSELVKFQSKFLVGVNANAALAWEDQRWGLLFLKAEKEFGEVYAPYCANYVNIEDIEWTPEQERNLSSLNQLIHFKGELPAFLIKPIGRAFKYPLLLSSLIKATSSVYYPHYEELRRGLEASKRVSDLLCEAQRRAENEQTVKSLRTRIDDWKGHNLEDFGDLLLDDIFEVVQNGVTREYHVFLFERMLFFCKEVSLQKKKMSILSSRSLYSPRRKSPLLNKGRVFPSSITHIVFNTEVEAISSRRWSRLTVHWKGQDGPESITIRCRNEQLKQWEKQINGLIQPPVKTNESDASLGFDPNPDSTTPPPFAPTPPQDVVHNDVPSEVAGPIPTRKRSSRRFSESYAFAPGPRPPMILCD
ncbi:Dbl homology domain-containing protein [Mycena metata]|uniref:Dbl homology domain-containing protein n=1 Tax=Mycena metata TaxID=1033252 RepID=A0AAD7IM54_9AGAR|nr:Dbl homology domain-containing protein [Mycena metata]